MPDLIHTSLRTCKFGEILPRRVVIIRALQLGDLLCAVPAFRAIRAALPEAEIVLIGLPWAREFVERYGCYLDRFVEFPGFPGLPEREPQIRRMPEFLQNLQAEKFDLAIQLHGSGPFVNPLTMLIGARRAAGFYLPGDYCPDPALFMPWPTEGLEVHRLLKLVEFLGLPACGEDLEFPLFAEDHEALHELYERHGLRQRDYVCVHPGASIAERRWPVERFAVVADALAARGLAVVLTGSAAEASLTRNVTRTLRAAPVDLAGQTNLGTLAALFQGTRLLICNDTGVSHLAAALGVPSIVISTGDNPARWAPANHQRHHVLCRATGVTPADVLSDARELLAHGRVSSDSIEEGETRSRPHGAGIWSTSTARKPSLARPLTERPEL
jgi:ADP-heptose:LPS heptosyltransferase